QNAQNLSDGLFFVVCRDDGRDQSTLLSAMGCNRQTIPYAKKEPELGVGGGEAARPLHRTVVAMKRTSFHATSLIVTCIALTLPGCRSLVSANIVNPSYALR